MSSDDTCCLRVADRISTLQTDFAHRSISRHRQLHLANEGHHRIDTNQKTKADLRWAKESSNAGSVMSWPSRRRYDRGGMGHALCGAPSYSTKACPLNCRLEKRDCCLSNGRPTTRTTSEHPRNEVSRIAMALIATMERRVRSYFPACLGRCELFRPIGERSERRCDRDQRLWTGGPWPRTRETTV